MVQRFHFRPARPTDGTFLGDMFRASTLWRADHAERRREALAEAERRAFVGGWMRAGDVGYIAETAQRERLGAAWLRVMPGDRAAGVATGPVLTLGVHPDGRAGSVRRSLLQTLCAHAALQGHRRLTLRIEPGDPEAALYRGEGFAYADGDAMVKRLG